MGYKIHNGIKWEQFANQICRKAQIGVHACKIFWASTKFKDFDPETWRYRIGAWRFFYEIDDNAEIVFMIAAYHRSSAYKT